MHSSWYAMPTHAACDSQACRCQASRSTSATSTLPFHDRSVMFVAITSVFSQVRPFAVHNFNSVPKKFTSTIDVV